MMKHDILLVRDVSEAQSDPEKGTEMVETLVFTWKSILIGT